MKDRITAFAKARIDWFLRQRAVDLVTYAIVVGAIVITLAQFGN